MDTDSGTDPGTDLDSDTDVPQVPVTDELVLDLLDDDREVAGVLGAAYPDVPAGLWTHERPAPRQRDRALGAFR